MTGMKAAALAGLGLAGGLLLSQAQHPFRARHAEAAPAPAPAAVEAADAQAPAPVPVEIRVVHVAPDPAPAAAAAHSVPASWEPVAQPRHEAPRQRDREIAPYPVPQVEPAWEPAPERAPSASGPEPETAPQTPEYRDAELPAGTALRARLRTPLSSRTASAGDPVEATLAEPVWAGGVEALPSGTVLRGVVREARAAGRVKGNGRLALLFHEAELPDGTRTSLGASWEQTAQGKSKRDAGIIGGSAAGGALLGQIFGKDSEGTLGGAILGGAIGTGVVLANKGREVEVPAGQLLILEMRGAARVPVRDP
jgi:type IV secretory pathway VirB10-like protein